MRKLDHYLDYEKRSKLLRSLEYEINRQIDNDEVKINQIFTGVSVDVRETTEEDDFEMAQEIIQTFIETRPIMNREFLQRFEDILEKWKSHIRKKKKREKKTNANKKRIGVLFEKLREKYLKEKKERIRVESEREQERTKRIASEERERELGSQLDGNENIYRSEIGIGARVTRVLVDSVYSNTFYNVLAVSQMVTSLFTTPIPPAPPLPK